MILVPHAFIPCLLHLLPVPPSVIVNDITLQLYPVNTADRCQYNSTVAGTSNVNFYLFSPRREQIKSAKQFSLSSTNFNFNLPTAIFIHGFLGSSSGGSSKQMRQAYLQRGGYNFVAVDAQKMFAGPWYLSAINNSRTVGKNTAELIDYLVHSGVRLESIHLIGHSLGAHAAGVAGKYVRSGKLSRITGLDPAGPLFDKFPNSRRLDSSDALFVDVIHTDSGGFGTNYKSGHVDFYPNNGRALQPGCGPRTNRSPVHVFNNLLCSHTKSISYFIQSVLSPTIYPAVKCGSGSQYRTNRCTNNEMSYMGISTPTTARGKYYLTIRGNQKTK